MGALLHRDRGKAGQPRDEGTSASATSAVNKKGTFVKTIHLKSGSQALYGRPDYEKDALGKGFTATKYFLFTKVLVNT